jgi:hypothetical protein
MPLPSRKHGVPHNLFVRIGTEPARKLTRLIDLTENAPMPPISPVLLSEARILAAYLIFLGSYFVFALASSRG